MPWAGTALGALLRGQDEVHLRDVADVGDGGSAQVSVEDAVTAVDGQQHADRDHVSEQG